MGYYVIFLTCNNMGYVLTYFTNRNIQKLYIEIEVQVEPIIHIDTDTDRDLDAGRDKDTNIET